MDKISKIYIAGHCGLVGSAILRKLQELGYSNIVYKTHEELDLTRQNEVETFFEKERPAYVVNAAAKVGGIVANSTYPANFIYDNLMISTNIIHSAYKYGVTKLLNLGSSCIYPANAPQPMKENDLLTSELEKTNEAYAIAKISAIKLCHYYNKQYGTNFISVMPTNQYGTNDNFNMETAHLLPMILRRFHLAKLYMQGNIEAIIRDLEKYPIGWDINLKKMELEDVLDKIGVYKEYVKLWGDGQVYRELMSSDDLAEACVYLLENKNAEDIGEFVNITSGSDIKLEELYKLVKNIVGYEGRIEYDITKPNGVYRKLMDNSKIKALGWTPKITLVDGIKRVYSWYNS